MMIRYLALLLIIPAARAGEPSCVLPSIMAGGQAMESRFFAASPSRVKEVMADAMQAAGAVLFRVTDQRIEGERVAERIKVLNLSEGDETIVATVEPASRDETVGTTVRVETQRRGKKRGAPKHAWSAGVLDHAGCLLQLLSSEDPSRRAAESPPSGPEVHLNDGTIVELLARRFFFNADLKPNQLIAFETVACVNAGGEITIPRGLLAVAVIDDATDIGALGKGARGELHFKYLILPGGRRLPLRGQVDLRGKGFNKAGLIAATVAIGVGPASITGRGFAIPAGSLFRAELDGEQTLRAPSIIPK